MRRTFSSMHALAAAIALTLSAPLMADAPYEANPADNLVGTPILDARQSIENGLRQLDNRANVVNAEPTGVEGVYQVRVDDGSILYTTADAKYLFGGSLYMVDQNNLVDLTMHARSLDNLKMLESTPESEMIVYEPENTMATVTVFTDVDCPFCQKMHEQIQELTDYGIKVRYMAFPRTGLNSPTAEKMNAIWCSDDPKGAMDKVIAGEAIEPIRCDDSPVTKHYGIAQQLFIQGTPSIIFENGTLQPGFANVESLVSAALENR